MPRKDLEVLPFRPFPVIRKKWLLESLTTSPPSLPRSFLVPMETLAEQVILDTTAPRFAFDNEYTAPCQPFNSPSTSGEDSNSLKLEVCSLTNSRSATHYNTVRSMKRICKNTDHASDSGFLVSKKLRHARATHVLKHQRRSLSPQLDTLPAYLECPEDFTPRLTEQNPVRYSCRPYFSRTDVSKRRSRIRNDPTYTPLLLSGSKGKRIGRG